MFLRNLYTNAPINVKPAGGGIIIIIIIIIFIYLKHGKYIRQ